MRRRTGRMRRWLATMLPEVLRIRRTAWCSKAGLRVLRVRAQHETCSNGCLCDAY